MWHSSSTHTLEALVYVAPSSVAGAGRGLFLRPREFPIKRGKYICVYSEVVCPRHEAERLRGRKDYLVEGGRGQKYDAEIFDSSLCNYGRFANDLGLQNTVKMAVCEANKRKNSLSIQRCGEMFKRKIQLFSQRSACMAEGSVSCWLRSSTYQLVTHWSCLSAMISFAIGSLLLLPHPTHFRCQ